MNLQSRSQIPLDSINSNKASIQDMERYTKENPFLTKVVANIELNKSGSQKDTRHISIDLSGSGIEYTPGDSLYLCPKNDAGLVNELLDLLKLDEARDVEFKRFSDDINITRSSNKLFKLISVKLGNKYNTEILTARFNGYNVVNIFKEIRIEYPEFTISSNELVDNSSKLQARAYSIASSLKAHPNLVELCISRVEEKINDQIVLGVCSNYICDRVPVNSKEVGIYLHKNDKFRLPDDPSIDIIMVGPGTGIAPFRAFIEERNYIRSNSSGKLGVDWLFFGDQRRDYDFLYEKELTKYEKDFGLRLTTAFSRDQEQKVYVQHRMKENSNEIYKLLKSGAYFYVCGDARRMAKDVDTALKEIFAEHGEDSEAAIKQLKDSNRYCRDVY